MDRSIQDIFFSAFEIWSRFFNQKFKNKKCELRFRNFKFILLPCYFKMLWPLFDIHSFLVRKQVWQTYLRILFEHHIFSSNNNKNKMQNLNNHKTLMNGLVLNRLLSSLLLKGLVAIFNNFLFYIIVRPPNIAKHSIIWLVAEQLCQKESC